MPPTIEEFARRSERLLRVSEAFQDSLAGTSEDRREAEQELVEAIPPPPALPTSPLLDEDQLTAVLLELQSGNLLVAAGVQTDAGAPPAALDNARQQIQAAKTQVEAPPAPQRLSAAIIRSSNLPTAKEGFRSQSGEFLKEIVDEVETTIEAALGPLKSLVEKYGGGAVNDFIKELGTPFPGLADASLLVRRGLESVKRALAALARWLGESSLSALKPDLETLWAKLREEGGRAVLEHVIGAKVALDRVENVLSTTTRPFEQVDEASNKLPPISGNFLREIRLVRLIVRGLALAAVLLGVVFAATVWVPLALGAALFAAIGAALLIGGEYTGGRRLLSRVQGVEQIAEDLGTA
jgi:hypothetical protein